MNDLLSSVKGESKLFFASIAPFRESEPPPASRQTEVPFFKMATNVSSAKARQSRLIFNVHSPFPSRFRRAPTRRRPQRVPRG